MLTSQTHGKSSAFETAALGCGLPRRSPAHGQRKPLTAACALNIDAKRHYARQNAAQPPLPAVPAEAAEVRALRTANKGGAGTRHLKKAITILAVSDPMSLLQFIDQQRIYYPVPPLCQVLGIVLSHYYGWRYAQVVEATESTWGKGNGGSF